MDKNCPFFEKNKNTFENRELFDMSVIIILYLLKTNIKINY